MQRKKMSRLFRVRSECREELFEMNLSKIWKSDRKTDHKMLQLSEKCDPRSVPYCITKALIDAVRGDIKNGLIFCGENVDRIHEMTTVHDLMQELCY